MAQAVNHQALTAQALIQSQASPCGIWDGQRWKRLLPIHSSIHLSPTLQILATDSIFKQHT